MKELAKLIFEVLREAARFSRKSPPDLDRSFGRKHFPGFASGACVYCDKPNADQSEACAGPR